MMTRCMPGSTSGRLLSALALVALLSLLVAAGPARAEFRVTSFSTEFRTPSPGPDPDGVPLPGDPVTQAGSHADLVTNIAFGTTTDPVLGLDAPDEQAKDVQVDLPAGFYGNPQAVSACDWATINQTQGFCQAAAQVGVLQVQQAPDMFAPFNKISFPVYNMPVAEGETATFAALIIGAPVKISITARTDSDYGLRATITNLNQALPIYATTLTLWGNPSDPRNDATRYNINGTPGATLGGPARPFLTMPTRCEELTTSLVTRSWQSRGTWVSATDTIPAPTGCDKLVFEPTLSARPELATSGAPSAYDIELSVPQDQAATGIATPLLRKAVVKLPEGVTISPSSAQGLEGCSDAQLKLGSKDEPTCPDASKIGTVSIETPLLPDPLTGDIVLGTPKPGQLFRLFLVARGAGLLLKIPGTVTPDERTGQLTAVFDDTPQLPFSSLRLHFKGGDRAPLANPQSCGTKTTTSNLTPWAGPAASSTDSFEISGGTCGAAFAPSLEAGTTNPQAGAFSPFTMTIRRGDGDQELSGISVALPAGLLGVLAGIPQCAEAQATAGTCDASTQVGTTTVESGAGNRPLPLTGKVFLGGAYKGAPYSLSIVVRAVAGPFDLGTVVVRAPLNIDANGGKVAVPADPLPTILQGVQLRLRTINITLDRPGFMFNATSCATSAVTATLTSVGGATATPSSRYQPTGCANLPLSPAFGLRLTGGAKNLRKNAHPGLEAVLSQDTGESGLKQVAVTLPAGVSVDLKNAQGFCKTADAAARKCADSAIVGQAAAKTAALPGELAGPVYLVQGNGTGGSQLPRLWLKLEGGGVPLDLWANTAFANGRLTSTFTNIPDAPITSFRLKIDGGAKGILQTGRDQCTASRGLPVQFSGQNGKVVKRTLKASTDCAPRIAKTKVTASSVSLTVIGIGAGKVSVSGSGTLKASKTIKSADIATITAKLSASTKRKLARTGQARLRLAVVYKPTAGKSTTLRKTVTVRMAKR